MQYLDVDPVTGAELPVEVRESMVEMPDGVRLYTLCLLPEGEGTFPIVFIRNPYVTLQTAVAENCREHAALIRGGYAVVIQHCRGCGRSEGECHPYQYERGDGLATLDWIRKQPFYQQEIYLSGGSYLSSVHFSYLDTAPADIRGAVLPVQEIDRYDILYRNGFLKLGLHVGWAVRMHKKKQLPSKNFVQETGRTLPLENIGKTIFGESIPSFDEPLLHPWPEDPYWQTPEGGVHYLHALDKLDIPVLFVTAFYDIYTEGLLKMWRTMPEKLRKKSALVITPYDHGFEGVGKLFDFPKSHLSQEWPDFRRNWFDAIRGRDALRFAKPGNVTWYEQFGGVWHTAPALNDGARELAFYLTPGGLSPEPAEETGRTIVYNPFAPATFAGGCCRNFGGMQVQDPPNSRYDIASFVTSPFAEATVWQGAASLELRVKSDCPDTAFYARVSLVRNNVAYGMRDDIVSLRRQFSDYRPGGTVTLKLDFTANAVRIQPGDALRLDVSCSCWPHFVPHTNRAGLYSRQTGADIAHNTVFLGKSCFRLKVL